MAKSTTAQRKHSKAPSQRNSFVTKEFTSPVIKSDKIAVNFGFTEDTIRDLESQINKDPVRVARRCQKLYSNLDAGFREGLYTLLELAFKVASHFVTNKKAWKDFSEDPFWSNCDGKQPKLKDEPEEIFRWVTRHLFKATKTEGACYLRAYKHARILYGYFRDKVPADKVAKKLAKEGADYAFDLETEKHPRQSKEDKSTTRAQTAKVKDSNNRVSASSISGKQAASQRQDEVPVLHVEMTLGRLVRVLSLPVGGKAQITVTREEGASDWKRIVATGVRVLED